MKFPLPIIFIPSIIIFICVGCSSTYRISDFSSKVKFYNNFNKFAENKDLKVTLTNDSTFTTEGKARISNDTLIIAMRVRKEIKINKNEVKDIKYVGDNMSNLSASIILKSGKKAESKNVNLLSDSSVTAVCIDTSIRYLPINLIREIRFKNHLLGVPSRLVIGTAAGFGTGYLLGFILYESKVDNGNSPGVYEIWGGTALGMVIGGILGWIHGYECIYQFNP